MQLDKDKLPKHVAIIMDGNRRWARKQGLDILNGHNYVVDEVLEPIVDRCIELGIEYLTLWAFSTENWKRSSFEVSGLMNIFRKVLRKKMEDLMEKGVRLRVVGDLSRFPEDIRKMVDKWLDVSRENDKITVVLALNYGGRDEILRTVRKVVDEVKINDGEVDVDEGLIEKYLDTAGMPDPDFIIRTGGAKRMSGFMPWQSVYSEFYFTDTYMPDFDANKLDEALMEFISRDRRFGK